MIQIIWGKQKIVQGDMSYTSSPVPRYIGFTRTNTPGRKNNIKKYINVPHLRRKSIFQIASATFAQADFFSDS